MKNVVLNCEKLLQKEEAHSYLAQALDFPDYYGHNLDALFDCLTEMGECTIVLEAENVLRQTDCYGIKVLKVLEEAGQANPRLTIQGRNGIINLPQR